LPHHIREHSSEGALIDVLTLWTPPNFPAKCN
jgi:hypothetical protein